ncbi:thermonuclease family protein [Candidatus Gracilibacteria bacterium]|nr:thermonuclease family protein [Candidatus Gracilibacteria bacterium]
MKYFSLLLFLLLGACSSTLPNKEQELSEFIPKDEIKISVEMDFDWKAKNFPFLCDWTKLERIVDGDTIIVTGGVRVRFIGIDTPEIKHPDKPIQKFGLEASNQMEVFLPKDSKICLLSDSIGDKYDKYDRKLAYIFTEDGLDINAEMLKGGWARGYFGFPFERKEEFRMYEKYAKEAQLNIWK